MPETVPVTPRAAGERIVGRYALEALIDEGVRAPLYRAQDTKLQRVVAIELLADIAGNGLRRMRFERAAAAVAALAHPNIVSILDHGGNKEGGYLVSEWLTGESLATRMKREPLATDEVLSIVRQLLAALAAMHGAGLVHRNVKPSTVFLQRSRHGRSERVKLIALGSATLGASAVLPKQPLTAAGERSGSPAEPALGMTQDARSDVYAVGSILAQALTHVLPNTESGANGDSGAPEPPLLRPTLGVALQALIARATAAQAKDRFADAAAMLCELVDGLPRAPKWTATDEPAADVTVVSAPPLAAADPGMFAEDTVVSPPPAAAIAHGLAVASSAPAAAAITATSARVERTLQRQYTAAKWLGALGATLLLISLLTSDTSRSLLARVQTAIAASLRPGSPRLESLPGSATSAIANATDLDTALGSEQPGASAQTPVAAPAPRRTLQPTVQRLAARNPWLDPVPTELQGLPALIATGADVDGNVIRTLRQFTLAHMDDPRGHLLLGHVYLNRLWRADGLFEISVALRRDPTARGAPEVLPSLVQLVVHGKVSEPATALIEKAYGQEALGAIEQALAELRNTEGASRLRALRSRLLAELGN